MMKHSPYTPKWVVGGCFLLCEIKFVFFYMGYAASNVSPNAYPFPMFEGVKNSGGNTYAGKANVLKQLVGGYSAAGVSVNGVVYDKNTNVDALSISGNMVMFKPGTTN